MQLTTEYWGRPAIEARMEELERLKPRDWKKSLEQLDSIRAALVKGEKGEKVRMARLRRVRQLRETHTLAEIGWMMGGISRQRVYQIFKTTLGDELQ